jgi:4-hydroxy-4-methyl-2-oxoglutarate aldolase
VASVLVTPGDLVFGDADGVVIVPQSIETEVMARALQKLKGERSTLADLRAGMSLGVVFEKYGIL